MDLLMCLSLINFEWREWQDVIDQLQQVSKVSNLFYRFILGLLDFQPNWRKWHE